MAATAFDAQKSADDIVDAGVDLIKYDVTSPVSGSIFSTRIDVGTDVTAVLMDVSNPLFAQLTTSTAEIGNVTNSGTFATQATVTGTDAEDAAVTANPVLVGGRYDATARSLDDGDAGGLALSSTGTAYVNQKSKISTVNSSATPLGIGATFTGTAEDVSDYSGVAISIDSNQSSATDGISIEWGSDGTSWDKTETHSLTGDTPFNHVLTPEAQYFRVVYTNGGTGQTHFRLETILHATSLSPRQESLSNNLHLDDLAVTVRSVLAAFNGTNYENIGSTAGNNLKVSVEEIDGTATVAVTNAGVFAVQEDGDALTALQLIDDIVVTLGTATYSEATTKGAVIGAVRNDDLATLVDTDNEIAPLQVTEEGALWVEGAPSTEDAGNSSTLTLTSGSTFTGTGVDLLHHVAVTIAVDSSHDSATDGMTFQFSQDNTNWDGVHTFMYTAANGQRHFQFGVEARYFRVVYTNGGTGQTTFRLQTLLHHDSPITTIHRVVDDTDPDRSAILAKTVIIAQAAGSGDFVPVQATASGNFKTSTQEISDGLDIGAGNAGSETQRMSISTDDVNLAAMNTSLAIMDDWDETNRAAVNLVASQVGVVGGTGVDAANALRVSLATDIPLPAGTNNIGDVDVATIAAQTAGGCDFYYDNDLDETKAEVKGSAGTLYGGVVINLKSSVLYLQVFNKAAANVTVGTTVPDMQFVIPTAGTTNGAGFVIPVPPCGIAMGTGITVACTTDSEGISAPGANECQLNLFYK